MGFFLCIWQNYIMSLFGSLMDNQTWTEEESVSKQELRSALLETACGLKRINCIKKAKALFKQYVESNGTFRYVEACYLWVSFLGDSDSSPSIFLEIEIIFSRNGGMWLDRIRLWLEGSKPTICSSLYISVGSQAICSKSYSVWLLNQMKIGRFCSTSTDTPPMIQRSAKCYGA